MLDRIAQIIFDKKGFNILAIDVQGISTITDFIVIAEGNVDRHVVSIAHAIIYELGEWGERLQHSEGLQSGDWVVLDYGQIMIHLFTPGLRDRYSLERLWSESKLIDLEIDTKGSSLLFLKKGIA